MALFGRVSDDFKTTEVAADRVVEAIEKGADKVAKAVRRKKGRKPKIEADTLVDVVTDDFKDAVAREFKRIAYTGTMGWRKKLNRPAHEVAIGIWLAGII